MVTDQIKVGVVVPSGDMVHARFMVSLVSLIQYSQAKGINVVLINPRSSLIATGRQMGVDLAIERGCTHILWLDSDMTFPHTLLEKWLAEKTFVIGATYVRRQPGGTLVHQEIDGIEPFVGEGVREVRTLPSGCLLVAAHVYGDMTRPYYRCSYEGGKEIGEDVWFCGEVWAAGHSIWLDADVSKQIGHIGAYVYTTGDIQ